MRTIRKSQRGNKKGTGNTTTTKRLDNKTKAQNPDSDISISISSFDISVVCAILNL